MTLPLDGAASPDVAAEPEGSPSLDSRVAPFELDDLCPDSAPAGAVLLASEVGGASEACSLGAAAGAAPSLHLLRLHRHWRR